MIVPPGHLPARRHGPRPGAAIGPARSPERPASSIPRFPEAAAQYFTMKLMPPVSWL